MLMNCCRNVVRVAVLVVGSVLSLSSTSCTTSRMDAPVARVVPQSSVVHGLTRVDDYAWLRERTNPDVITYLQLENAYTEGMTEHTARLRDRLYEEMKGRIKETDEGVPMPHDAYVYYSKTYEGKQYSVHCRKLKGDDSSEQVILDQNELAEGHAYFRLSNMRVSPDHHLLAFATDTNGSETYSLRVKDLRTGEMLPDRVENTYYGLEWGNDNKTLYYTVLDDAKRPYQCFRHTLGEHDNELVYHEADEKFHLSLSKSRSGKFVFVDLRSQITSETRFMDADFAGGTFQVMSPRVHGVEYSPAHHGTSFYITTNDNATNFKVVRAPVANPGRANWSEYIGHDPKIKIEGVTPFANHLVISERSEGLRRIRIRDVAGGGEHYVTFDEPVYVAYVGGNREFDTATVRVGYSSMVTPRSVYDYRMDTKTRELLKRDEVLGGYDPLEYEAKRVFATASDGTQIPISLVHRRGIVLDGTNPTLLYGYGSYGSNMEPWFRSSIVSLLDRDFVYAIGHIRGGGEMGRSWYLNGKFLKKKNTFTDFIACAEHLVAKGYTSPDKLAIQGGSAGGLLMGAVTNMRPDLFAAVVAQVPFVDVVNTMLDETIPLTVIEFEEWGNPKDRAFFDYMMSYSPYDNVMVKAYPNMLITGGLNDPRVAYWEPAKWTAKLRAKRTDDNLLLLKTNMGAGHGGASGRYGRLKDTAFVYAFILDMLGIDS